MGWDVGGGGGVGAGVGVSSVGGLSLHSPAPLPQTIPHFYF
jgi:hypothetical protein